MACCVSGTTVTRAQSVWDVGARSYEFNLSSQPLGKAVVLFTKITGLDVIADGAVIGAMKSNAVSGTMTADEALRRMLKDTGATYHYTDGTTVALKAFSDPFEARAQAIELEQITVEGQRSDPNSTMTPPAPYAGGQVATGGQLGLLGNRDVFDAPFNVTNYTAQTIEDQQARTVGDVVANDPSVRINWPRGSYAENFTIRGFNYSNPNVSFGGLYGILPHDRIPVEIAERIEVLKGPSALLYGQNPGGVIGGNINVVPKRAGEQPMAKFTGSYFSDGQPYGHADVSTRFGPDKAFGIRVNGAYRDGQTPVDLQKEQVGMGSVALDYRSDRVRASADIGYQYQDYAAPSRYATLAAGVPVPEAPDASSNFHAPWTRVEQKEAFGVLRGEFDVTSDITAFGAIGARQFRSDNLLADPAISNARGDFSAYSYWFPYDMNALSSELGVRGKFDTGPVGHKLSLVWTNLDREFFSSFNGTGTFSSNIYNPVYPSQPSLAGLNSDPPRTSRERLASVALADTLSFVNDRILLTVGVRAQSVESESFDGTTGVSTAHYDEKALTPAVGLVVKPWQRVSIYGNYIEGLTTGPTAPNSADNHGQIFAPIKSTQIEAGVKVDFGRFATTLSVFEIKQPVGITDPTTLIYGVDGEQRNRGVEFNTFGEVTKGVRVLGGVVFIDGVQTETVGGATDGKKAVGVPEVNVNLGTELDIPQVRGLSVSGRLIYTSSQYLDAANLQSIPAWTRFDLGARYRLERRDGKPIIFRASVENVFDKSYWASTNGGRLTIGAPRTFLLSTTFEF